MSWSIRPQGEADAKINTLNFLSAGWPRDILPPAAGRARPAGEGRQLMKARKLRSCAVIPGPRSGTRDPWRHISTVAAAVIASPGFRVAFGARNDSGDVPANLSPGHPRARARRRANQKKPESSNEKNVGLRPAYLFDWIPAYAGMSGERDVTIPPPDSHAADWTRQTHPPLIPTKAGIQKGRLRFAKPFCACRWLEKTSVFDSRFSYFYTHVARTR